MLTFPVAVMLAGLITQDRPVETFHALSLSGGLEVTVKRGGKPRLVLKGEPDDLAKIESAVKGGRLVVGPKAGTWRIGDVTAEIVLPSFDGLEASGGVVVKGDGLLASTCDIKLSGGVEISLERMACEALKLGASGGADIALSGVTKRLELDLSGGVDLDTRAMNVSEAKIRASGGVSGELAVSDLIDADLSGGVSMKVKGQPKVARAKTSGSADLSYE